MSFKQTRNNIFIVVCMFSALGWYLTGGEQQAVTLWAAGMILMAMGD